MLSLSGCWFVQRSPGPAPARPLERYGLTRIGVVEFGDLTHQRVGGRWAAIFREELTRALGKECVRTEPLAGPTGVSPAGLLGIGQAQQLGRLNGVDGLLTGQVLASQHQPRPGRVVVTASVRLLEAGRGTIIRSQTATGTVPVSSSDALNAGYDAAIKLAAKEFLNVLLGSPS